MRLFPKVREKLELSREVAKEHMAHPAVTEQDKSAIAQRYASECLLTLRQLRHHCMHSKLDGWRHGAAGTDSRKMLIVDDSLVTRKLIARAFEKANFHVDLAVDGREGLDKMKHSVYDVVFMDLDMPNMNGIDCTRRLREWEDVQRPQARQPICALTGAFLDEVDKKKLHELKQAGLDVFESKPANIPRLLRIVDDVSDVFGALSVSQPAPPP